MKIIKQVAVCTNYNLKIRYLSLFTTKQSCRDLNNDIKNTYITFIIMMII